MADVTTLTLHGRADPRFAAAIARLEIALSAGAQPAEIGFDFRDGPFELVSVQRDADFAGRAGDVGFVFEPGPALLKAGLRA